jgi:hypothetical protein
VTAPLSLLSLMTVTVSIMCDREECSFIFVIAEGEGERGGERGVANELRRAGGGWRIWIKIGVAGPQSSTNNTHS